MGNKKSRSSTVDDDIRTDELLITAYIRTGRWTWDATADKDLLTRIFKTQDGRISATLIRDFAYTDECGRLPASRAIFAAILVLNGLIPQSQREFESDIGSSKLIKFQENIFSQSFDYVNWAKNFPMTDFIDLADTSSGLNYADNPRWWTASLYLDYIFKIIRRFGFETRIEELTSALHSRRASKFLVALSRNLNIPTKSTEEDLIRRCVVEMQKPEPKNLYMNHWCLSFPDHVLITWATNQDKVPIHSKFLSVLQLEESQIALLRERLISHPEQFHPKMKETICLMKTDSPPPYS